MTSIIEQFNALCDDDTLTYIICPTCGTKIHQYSHWAIAADHIKHGRCPICDCENGDCDNDEGSVGLYEWCEHCVDLCEKRQVLKKQAVYDKHIDIEIKYMKECKNGGA